MANTYSQLNIHAVFTVKGRENLLKESIRTRLFEYISGIIKGLDLFPLAVNGFTDHVHVFLNLTRAFQYLRLCKLLKLMPQNG